MAYGTRPDFVWREMGTEPPDTQLVLYLDRCAIVEARYDSRSGSWVVLANGEPTEKFVGWMTQVDYMTQLIEQQQYDISDLQSEVSYLRNQIDEIHSSLRSLQQYDISDLRNEVSYLRNQR